MTQPRTPFKQPRVRGVTPYHDQRCKWVRAACCLHCRAVLAVIYNERPGEKPFTHRWKDAGFFGDYELCELCGVRTVEVSGSRKYQGVHRASVYYHPPVLTWWEWFWSNGPRGTWEIRSEDWDAWPNPAETAPPKAEL